MKLVVVYYGYGNLQKEYTRDPRQAKTLFLAALPKRRFLVNSPSQ